MIKILAAILLLTTTTSGALPAVGDNVKLSYDGVIYHGQITDIDDTWICLNLSYLQNPHTNEKRNIDGETCFGIAGISLGWQ